MFYTSSDLRVHVESQHEGVKYACSQCPYQAKQQTHLIEHKRSIHEGLKRRRPQFGCKMCDYRTCTVTKFSNWTLLFWVSEPIIHDPEKGNPGLF